MSEWHRQNQPAGRNFRIVEKQLRAQDAWVAIEYCETIGVPAFLEEMRHHNELRRFNMRADLIIERGLEEETAMDVDEFDCSGEVELPQRAIPEGEELNESNEIY